jgi:HD-GYP domain-containing protein (c-di-GMP phosphodiesterase class II)
VSGARTHAGTEVIAERRSLAARRLPRRSLLVAHGLGALFLAAAAPMALLLPSTRPVEPLTVLLLVVGYALAFRVVFEVGMGAAVPTQLLLVPMLFLLPAGIVPLCVAAGALLATFADNLRSPVQLERASLRLVGSWHAVGPALVLGLAGEPGVSRAAAPVLALALAAQWGLDFASGSAYEWLVRRGRPAEQLRPMSFAFLVDGALAPVGLLAAAAAPALGLGFLLLLPLVGLLAVFARERRERIDHALELSHAYRGTAFLLGDVIEADDAYTGSHSRDVVELSVDVAAELDLDAGGRRLAELVALLHDVGKIRIPGEIINKPGPLSPAERAVVNRHTIAGEEMLQQVGGLLAEVGRIVRSCHERWDGGGYPDGLAGEEIPLVARIVCCCDAFSAMTTDRSYRPALSLEEALAELRACAGTHFDPAVTAAVERVARAGRAVRAGTAAPAALAS